MFRPLSESAVRQHGSYLTSAPRALGSARENKHSKHTALLEAASLAAARIRSRGDLTPSSPGSGAAKLDWHTSGDRYLGQQVMRCVYDGAALAGMARATVIGYLPAAESDFEDALGRPQPLWLVRFSARSLLAGNEEELELHELLESIDSEDAAEGGGPEGAPHHGDDAAMDGFGASAGGMSDFSLDGSDWAGGGQPLDGRNGGRRGKRRCGQCATCKADDCDVCKFCRDKAKNGGANTLRRPCSARLPCCARQQGQESAAPAGDTSTAA